MSLSYKLNRQNDLKIKNTRAEFSRNGISAANLGQRQRDLQNQIKGANKEIDQQRNKLSRLNEKARQKIAMHSV